jgi:hypothetical protein
MWQVALRVALSCVAGLGLIELAVAQDWVLPPITVETHVLDPLLGKWNFV